MHSGQWIYSLHEGVRGIIDLDMDECIGDGTITVFNDSGGHNFYLSFDDCYICEESINEVRPVFCDSTGRILRNSEVENVVSSGISIPRKFKISFKMSEKNLNVSWSDDIHNSGTIVGVQSPSRLGEVSNQTSKILTWKEFKEQILSVKHYKYVFRGHESSKWSISTTFHRSGRSNLHKFCRLDIPDLQKLFNAITGRNFDLDNAVEYASILNMAQHHGYPTPLLDWTWSPFVAAFFAFRKIKNSSKEGFARIYMFDIHNWKKNVPRRNFVFPAPPHVSVVDAAAPGNIRSNSQQAISTVTNVDDVESFVREASSAHNIDYLQAFDIPWSERGVIMKELALMGVTAGSMFPGLDGACEALKERNSGSDNQFLNISE